MRYFLDTEFIDDGKTIGLISIGIVSEDKRELYLQSCEFDRKNVSSWVEENVLSHLEVCPWADVSLGNIRRPYINDLSYHKKHGQCVDQQRRRIHNCPWRTRNQMKHDLEVFFSPDSKIEVWGWCAGYDFVAICQLFGTMMDLPLGWPHYIRDIQYLLDEQSIDDSDLPQQEGTAHNALEDARHIQKLWEFLS